MKPAALARIGPRDPDDWPILACALALNCPIWTEDRDFYPSVPSAKGSSCTSRCTDRHLIAHSPKQTEQCSPRRLNPTGHFPETTGLFRIRTSTRDDLLSTFSLAANERVDIFYPQHIGLDIERTESSGDYQQVRCPTTNV